MTRRFIPILPTYGALLAVCLELDSEADDHGEPFVRVGSVGGDASSYRGYVCSADGEPLEPVLVQVPVVERLADAAWNMDRMESAWQGRATDRQALEAVQSRLFPRWLLPPKAAGDTFQRLPPLIYCRHHQRLYPLPSPRDLEPLQTCRDDKLLTQHDLPAFAVGQMPILVDRATLEEDGAPRFYVAQETAPEALAAQGVAGLAELRVELAETVAQRSNSAGFDRRRYPATGGDEAPWHVVTAYDAPYLVRRYEPWDFDRFVDFLGGREVDPVDLGLHMEPRSTTENGSGLTSQGYLFCLDGSGLDAIEVFVLKLTLFAQLVEALQLYYRRLGPHLDLHPDHLMVSAADPNGGLLPQRWAFNLRLLGLSGARRQPLAQDREGWPTSPSQPRRPYASRAVREAALVDWNDGELVIDRVFEERDGDTSRWSLQGRLRDPNGILPPPKQGDLLKIHWPQQLFGQGDMQTLAHADAQASLQSSELIFHSEPLELSAGLAQRMESAAGTTLRGGRYRLLPRLGVHDDIFSLGMLLLRVLLVDDRQDLATVEALVRNIPDPTRADRDTQGLTLGQQVEAHLAGCLEDHAKVLAATHVFYREEDRLTSRANAIPDEIWHGALRLAWRMLARGPGFGLETSEQQDPAAYLANIHQDVMALTRQLHLMLFRRQPVHVELHSVIAEMMAEIGQGG